MIWSAVHEPKDPLDWALWAVVSMLLAGGMARKIRGLRTLATQR